jgi:PKD repeat protein
MKIIFGSFAAAGCWMRGKSGLARQLLTATTVLAAIFGGQTVSAQAGARAKLTITPDGGQAQLNFQGLQSNQVYKIEASTNLINWTGISQRAATNGTLTVTDPQAGKFSQRYYQAVTPADLGSLGEDGYAPDRILVKPLPGVDLSGLNLSLGVLVLNIFPTIGNLEVVNVPPGLTSSTLIALFRKSGLVQYAEHDYYVQALATPDDQYYSRLWGFHNTGQFGGMTNADIDAPDAWDVQHDAGSIIVAVVDTGVRYTHEDLAANMWVNPADGSHGTNVVAGNTDPHDDYGHGTHCAGTIGAVGDNTVGVVGVAWHVQIMACKFLDAQGNGTIDGAIACLDYARSHGAKIVNASWGATSFTSQALHDAIASLRDAGILLVAAAGNSGADNDVTPLYPASYSDLDNIIAVAATDESNSLTAFSDYGATNVDLAAPGTLIYSCWDNSDSDYQYDDGTSMSAAMVSGAVAVMEAHFPGESYQQIKQQIMANVDPLPGLQGKCVSGGKLNLYKALTGGAPPPVLTARFAANPAGGQAPLTVQFTDESTGGIAGWNWNFGDGSAHSTAQNPSHTYSAAGNFTAMLTVTGTDGSTSSKSQSVTVTNAPSSVAASFSANPTSGQAPLAVQFTDHSTGPVTAWNWNFGDGSAHSTAQSPSHTYTSADTFSASLTVSGSSGQTSSVSQTITVTNAPQPVTASFAANPSSGLAPLTVNFTDQSTGPVTAGIGTSATAPPAPRKTRRTLTPAPAPSAHR